MNDAGPSNSPAPSRGSGATDAQLSAELRKWTGATPAPHPVGELLDRHWEAGFAYARLCTDGPRSAGVLTTAAFTRLFGETLRQNGPTSAWRPHLLVTVRRIAAEWAGDHRRDMLHPDLRTGGGDRPAGRLLPPPHRRLLSGAFPRLPQAARCLLWHVEVEAEPLTTPAGLLGLDEEGARAELERARDRLREECLQLHRELAPDDECRRYLRLLDVTYRRGGRDIDPDLRAHIGGCGHCAAAADQLDHFNRGLGAALAEAVLGWGGRQYAEARLRGAVELRPASGPPTGGQAEVPPAAPAPELFKAPLDPPRQATPARDAFPDPVALAGAIGESFTDPAGPPGGSAPSSAAARGGGFASPAAARDGGASSPAAAWDAGVPSPAAAWDGDAPSHAAAWEVGVSSPAAAWEGGVPSPAAVRGGGVASSAVARGDGAASSADARGDGAASPAAAQDGGVASSAAARGIGAPSSAAAWAGGRAPMDAAGREGGAPSPAAARDGGAPSPAAARDGGAPSPVAARDDGAPSPAAGRDDCTPSPAAARGGGAPSPVAVPAGGEDAHALLVPAPDTTARSRVNAGPRAPGSRAAARRSAHKAARRAARRRHLTAGVLTVSGLVVLPLALWSLASPGDGGPSGAGRGEEAPGTEAGEQSRDPSWVGAGEAEKGALRGRLHNVGSGLCVGVDGEKAVEDAEAELLPCSADSTQQWTYETDGLLRNGAAPGLCLDSRLGYSVRLAPCTGASQPDTRNVRYDFTLQGALVPRTDQDLALAPAATDGSGSLVLKARAEQDVQRWVIDTSKADLRMEAVNWDAALPSPRPTPPPAPAPTPSRTTAPPPAPSATRTTPAPAPSSTTPGEPSCARYGHHCDDDGRYGTPGYGYPGYGHGGHGYRDGYGYGGYGYGGDGRR